MPKRVKLSKVQKMTSSSTYGAVRRATTDEKRPDSASQHVLAALDAYEFRARLQSSLELASAQRRLGLVTGLLDRTDPKVTG